MSRNTRPIQFRDYLPEVFRADEVNSVSFLSRFLQAFEALFEELEAAIEGTTLDLTVQAGSDTTVTVKPFNTGLVAFPICTPVTVPAKALRSTLVHAIPANRTELTHIEVHDTLFVAALEMNDVLHVQHVHPGGIPDLFDPDATPPPQFTPHRPQPDSDEGTPDGTLELAVQAGSGTTVTVKPFNVGPVGFPIDTSVTVPDKALRSTLDQAIPANRTELTHIEVHDKLFVAALEMNDVLHVHPGDYLNYYLNYLASWIALPLRAEKPAGFNRAFFQAAIPLYPQRSTLVGLEKLLRAWLRKDLLENSPTDPPLLLVTDLTRTHNDVDTIFQLAPEGASVRVPGELYAQLGVNTVLGEFQLAPEGVPGELYAQLGVNTVLGEGPPFFFIADLITDSAVRDLRSPNGLDIFQRAARLLLDAEKPAYTYYQLRVRAHTMQLAPPCGEERKGEIYAQVGETTLLWDEPWVFDSEG
jgi:hypothetical protein